MDWTSRVKPQCTWKCLGKKADYTSAYTTLIAKLCKCNKVQWWGNELPVCMPHTHIYLPTVFCPHVQVFSFDSQFCPHLEHRCTVLYYKYKYLCPLHSLHVLSQESVGPLKVLLVPRHHNCYTKFHSVQNNLYRAESSWLTSMFWMGGTWGWVRRCSWPKMAGVAYCTAWIGAT